MYKIGVSTPKAIDEEMFKLYKEANIEKMEVSVDKWLSEALDYDKLLEWSKKYGMIPMRDVLLGKSGKPCVINRGFGSSCAEHQLYYYHLLFLQSNHILQNTLYFYLL